MNRLYTQFEKFKNRIAEVTQYIENITAKGVLLNELEVLSNTLDQRAFLSYLKSLASSTVQYNAIVISLYGCYENYVDSVLKEYLDVLLENVSDYNKLPPKLIEKYRYKLGEYLMSPQRFPVDELETTSAVRKFSEFAASNFDEGVDKVLLISHANNLNTKELFLLMRDMGIIDAQAKILNCLLFEQFYLEKVGMDISEFRAKRARKGSGDKYNSLFEPIETLVSQRNSVAHSWSEENRIAPSTFTNEIIPFLLMFGECILQQCLLTLFAYIPETSYSFTSRTPIKVIGNHVFCLNNQKKTIQVGDFLLYKSGEKVKCGKILSLQEEGVDITAIDDKQEKDVGVKIDTTIKEDDEICCIVNNLK